MDNNPLSASVEIEDVQGSVTTTQSGTTSSALTSSSPPAPALTPPSSPNVQVRELVWEPLELQLDYWQVRRVFKFRF